MLTMIDTDHIKRALALILAAISMGAVAAPAGAAKSVRRCSAGCGVRTGAPCLEWARTCRLQRPIRPARWSAGA